MQGVIRPGNLVGRRWLMNAVFTAAACLPMTTLAADTMGEAIVGLHVEGISTSVGEDNPRVLYILPWQAPDLPQRPRADLDSKAPQLIQPLNPLVLERHRTFRQTLNPLVLSPKKGSAVTVQ